MSLRLLIRKALTDRRGEPFDGCRPEIELVGDLSYAGCMPLGADMPGTLEGFLLHLHPESRGKLLDIGMGQVLGRPRIDRVCPDLTIAPNDPKVDRLSSGLLPAEIQRPLEVRPLRPAAARPLERPRTSSGRSALMAAMAS